MQRKERVTDMSIVADIIVLAACDRIWYICDQLSLFKKETGAQAVLAVPVIHVPTAVAADAPVALSGCSGCSGMQK